MRKNDLVGRWGGEEFLGIYEIKNDYEASIIAEKLRKLIENTEINHQDERLHVTISVGVTTPKIDDTIESIIERADKLMYKAKEKGRNRVEAD